MTPVHTVAKVVVVNDKHEVLLLRRSKTAPRRPLEWDFPGGGVDEGEGFLDAAARELVEEAQITVAPTDLRLVWAHTAIKNNTSVNWLMFVVRANTGKVTLSFEHDKHCWLPIEKAIKEIQYPLQKLVLEHIQEHKLIGLVA